MENILFENRVEVTRPLMRSWSNISRKLGGKHNHWTYYFHLISAALCGVLTTIAIPISNVSPLFFFVPGLCCFVYIYYFVLPTINAHRFLKSNTEQTGEKACIRNVVFGDNIAVTTGNFTVISSYDHIRFIVENEEYFCLFYDINNMTVIYKNAFTVGSADEFYSFITEKCSAQEPLWTQRELKKRIAEKRSTSIIIISCIFIALFFNVWLPAFQPITVMDVAKSLWGSEVQLITTVKVENGAAAFVTDGEDRIYSMLLKKSFNRYEAVTAYSHPVTALSEHGVRFGALFETPEDLLSYGDGNGTIVYGIANEAWWYDNIPDYQQEEYTVTLFQCRGVQYVLYYRAAVQ